MPDSIDEVLASFYAPERREAARRVLVSEGVLADLPLHALSDHERCQIDGRLFGEDMAAADGITVSQMIDCWERELATAQAFESVQELMEWLNADPKSKPVE